MNKAQMTKEAKIAKLKELRKFMQKRIAKGDGDEELKPKEIKAAVAATKASPKKSEDDEEFEKNKKEFFTKSNRLTPREGTKLMVNKHPTGSTSSAVNGKKPK